MRYNREEMKTVNLDACGLLRGLDGINYDTIKSYMKSVDYNRMKRDETIQCIAPSIRRILCKILETENQFNIFQREPNIQIEVMSMFNVNDIIDGLDTIYSELLPITEKYLPNIDSQAELTMLFCDNYVHTLIKKSQIKNNKETVKIVQSNVKNSIIAIICKDKDDFNNYIKENNIQGNRKSSKIFHGENQIYVCFSSICDTRGWPLDDYYETKSAKENKQYEDIFKMVKIQSRVFITK
jgi:hypothetical protein